MALLNSIGDRFWGELPRYRIGATARWSKAWLSRLSDHSWVELKVTIHGSQSRKRPPKVTIYGERYPPRARKPFDGSVNETLVFEVTIYGLD